MNKMTLAEFRALILSEGVKNVILDTDAYNEIDDQFCIAYMIKRPDKINLLSINAAPFFNENSWGYARIHDLETVVTAGVGYYGPPMRVGTDSEIVKIHLHP